MLFASTHFGCKHYEYTIFYPTLLSRIKYFGHRAASCGDTGAQLKAFKGQLGLYIGLFHFTYPFLSQNQRLNLSHQDDCCFLGCTVSVTVTGSLATPSELTAATV
mgnify:CR=1 FL=1